MKVVNKSTVELIDHMGNDITVVNAARVSFDKTSDYRVIGWKETIEDDGSVTQEPIKQLKEGDERLINYLAANGHWSPFAHTAIQLRLSSPIFVARQLVKHQVGLVWNEVSRRYVDNEPEFYYPTEWRKRAENKKQGSSNETVSVWEDHSDGSAEDIPYDAMWVAMEAYQRMLDKGVAPEQTRMILPQNMMTSWYWTGSLMAFYRVWKERTNAHAQLETQEVAKQIGTICEQLFPVSWAALKGEDRRLHSNLTAAGSDR